MLNVAALPAASAQCATCSSLAGSTGCGSASNCTHEASACCDGNIVVVTYTTTCTLNGGEVQYQTIANRLNTESLSVSNNCCRLKPSLGSTWGQICNLGDDCTAFDLTCF